MGWGGFRGRAPAALAHHLQPLHLVSVCVRPWVGPGADPWVGWYARWGCNEVVQNAAGAAAATLDCVAGPHPHKPPTTPTCAVCLGRAPPLPRLAGAALQCGHWGPQGAPAQPIPGPACPRVPACRAQPGQQGACCAFPPQLLGSRRWDSLNGRVNPRAHCTCTPGPPPSPPSPPPPGLPPAAEHVRGLRR
jgi:hypothetical protein